MTYSYSDEDIRALVEKLPAADSVIVLCDLGSRAVPFILPALKSPDVRVAVEAAGILADGYHAAAIEPITEARYHELMAKCRPIDTTSITTSAVDDDANLQQMECTGGACPVR